MRRKKRGGGHREEGKGRGVRKMFVRFFFCFVLFCFGFIIIIFIGFYIHTGLLELGKINSKINSQNCVFFFFFFFVLLSSFDFLEKN